MSLENRVQELEEELKVLKNEIQTTLLDIQEQILSHYYPALYASANVENQATAPSAPPAPTAPIAESAAEDWPEPAQRRPAPPAGKYKTQRVTLPVDTEVEEGEEMPAPFPPLPNAGAKQAPFHQETGGGANQAPYPQEAAPPARPAMRKAKAAPAPGETQSASPQQELLLSSDVPDDIFPHKPAKNGVKTAVIDDDDALFEEFENLVRSKITEDIDDLDIPSAEALDQLFEETFPFLDHVDLDLNFEDEPEDPQQAQPAQQDAIDSQAVRLTVKKLMTWVDESVAIIGRKRAVQAVEMYSRAGDLSAEMKASLSVLIESCYQPEPKERANIRQVIDTLGKLNDILDLHSPEYLDEVMNFIREVNFG